MLGPGRMPRVVIRFPRLVGVALVALGVLGLRELQNITHSAGVVVYVRALPVLTTVGLGLGGFLLVFGRPSDAHGYSPGWWNSAYLAILIVAVISALAVRAIWL